MNTHTKIAFPRATRLLLLAAVALLAAGCLPSAEDTLGGAPPGPVVTYYFDSGLIPSELTANISGNPSGGGWIIDNSTGGSESDSPSLSSGPFSPASLGANYCIGFDVSEDSSYIEFEYTFVAAGAIFTFAIDGSVSTIASADQLAWIGHEQNPADGPHTYTWCVSSTTAAGPSTLHIDDIEVWP